MKREYPILMFCVFVLSTAAVVGATLFDGGWRISVGAAYNAPTCVNLSFRPAIVGTGGAIVPPGYNRTKEEAQRIVAGTTEGTRTTFDNGSYIDTADIGSGDGTWNARVVDAVNSWRSEDGRFEVASAGYYEVEETAGGGRLKFSGEDAKSMPGVSVLLSRNIYHNYEYDFGVDIAFLFSYFFRTDLIDFQSAETRKYGTLASYLTPMDEFDPMQLNDDGSYGGSYGGAGPMFWRGITTTDIAGPSSHHWFRTYGDYRELEMALAVRPYYDVYEWLRLYATLGAAVSWGEFDMHSIAISDGFIRHHGCRFNQWDVYGIAGLGLMMRWHDFTFGLDFYGRFLQRDMDFDDEYVHGSIERGKWFFQGMFGYEF